MPSPTDHIWQWLEKDSVMQIKRERWLHVTSQIEKLDKLREEFGSGDDAKEMKKQEKAEMEDWMKEKKVEEKELLAEIKEEEDELKGKLKFLREEMRAEKGIRANKRKEAEE